MVPTYLFLLHESPDAYVGMGPSEIQQVIQKYVAWREGIEREGRFVAGQKLKSGGVALQQGTAGGAVLDRPLPEAKEVVGGFIMVRADSFEHAALIARQSPHFERGWIEVREVDNMDPA